MNMWKKLWPVLAVSLLCCSCGKTEAGVFYNGKELSESEIYELMYRETESDTRKAEYTLIAFDEEMASPTEASVFWTKSGSVFHGNALCRHLSNVKEVYYGTVENAASCGKDRACSVCEKEQ